MILRRVTQHVKDQNWFAVFLDFFIVVAGILIAFQITNWNEARQDRQAEQRYLAELARDLEADITQAREHQVGALGRVATSEMILAVAAPEHMRPGFWPEIEEDAVPEAIYSALPYAALTASNNMVSTDSTFEELIQTGNISVLSDRALVSDLTEFYSRMKRNMVNDEILLDQVTLMLGYLRRNGLGASDRATIEEVTLFAQTDKEFLGFVKSASFLAQWQYMRLNQIEAQAATLLATVNSARKEAR